MHERNSHPGAAYLRLVVDNSGRLTFDKKRGVKFDPASFTLTPHFLVDAGPIREAPKRFPVAHSTGRDIQQARNRRGASQRVNDFVYRHSPCIISSSLKIVKQLEPEKISGRDGAKMGLMTAQIPNPRSVEQIAARLRLTREALDGEKGAFYINAGIAANTSSQWEHGNGRPILDMAILLCDRYGLTLDWIYLGDPAGLRYDVAEKIAAQAPRARIAI